MCEIKSILVIDDEKDFTELLGEILSRLNYRVDKVADGDTGIKMIKQNPYDLVMLDLRMPDTNGFDILKEIKLYNPILPVIIISGDAKSSTLEQAIKLGAYDFLNKPIEWNRLEIAVKNAIIAHKQEQEINNLKSQIGEKYRISNLVGNSSKMQEVFRNVGKIINSNVAVCIQGESGVGKELLAKTIHFNGPRKDCPFIAVNCSTIPDSSLDEDLFGAVNNELHVRKYGKFEQANGGTLYLDDISELSPIAQGKIFKTLKENAIIPPGSNKPLELDIRVIVGSKKNLSEEVKKGNFREDLYFMIHVFPIFVPPLRERKEDIPALVNYFIEKYNFKNNRIIHRISREAMEYLLEYNWPGNVRELENVIERSIMLVEDDVILPQHLPISIISQDDSTINGGTYLDLKKAVALSNNIVPLDEIEEVVLKRALKINNYNMSSTAHKLGIGRTTLYRKLQKYQIKVER